MKKSFLSISALILTGGIFLFSGCAKDDTTAPDITLKGDASMTIFTGETFTDPLATAADEKDGDLTSKIVVTGTVDKTLAGTYTLTYAVVDAAGNPATEVIRTVIVKHKNTTIAGNYSTTETCNFGNVDAYNATITAGTGNTIDITFGNFGNYTNTVNVDGTVAGTTGQTITIPSKVYQGLTISGTGTVNAAGTVITITYSSGTDTCTSTWTKK